MSKRSKSIDTGNRLVVGTGWIQGSHLGDKDVLGGDGSTTLGIDLMLLNFKMVKMVYFILYKFCHTFTK